jgi:predicted small metal-binding protein
MPSGSAAVSVSALCTPGVASRGVRGFAVVTRNVEEGVTVAARSGTAMRKVADCRTMPSEMNCTLTISGEEEEVVRAATEHAVSVHGHEDTPELRDGIRESLTDEVPQHA